MKILVTGAAGFIGFHLINRLLREGHQVVGIDNLNNYYDVSIKLDRLKEAGIDSIQGFMLSKGVSSNLNKNYVFYKCDLQEEEKLNNIFKIEYPHAVCNLAAQAGVRYSLENPKAYINSNIIGFQNVIEMCRAHNIKNFSYASSSSVYGANTDLPFSTSDNVDHPMSLYAATKKSNELVAHAYAHLYDIRTTGLRFFTVYGPWGRPDMALFLFVKALFNKEPINVFNHGNMLRDYTYIDDIVEGVFRVINNPAQIPKEKTKTNPTAAPYKIYNIGNNNPIKLMDFISTIEDVIQKKFEINFMDIQAGDVPNTFANVDELVNDFNYKPSVNIRVGIGKFIKWYTDYYKIKI